jgi:hypothetical protein
LDQVPGAGQKAAAATASNMWRFCGERSLYATETIALYPIEAFNQEM